MVFPVSGIEVFPLWPFLAALGVSFFTSMAGVSGAFLLLPFQVSVLHFISPAVSSTNLVYNIFAIPGGVYRYAREGRLYLPLVAVTLAGSIPGMLVGFFLRVQVLPDPEIFKLFVGCVLLLFGGRLLLDLPRRVERATTESAGTENRGKAIQTVHWSRKRVVYRYRGGEFGFHVPGVLTLAFFVGIVGGAYGVGGGALLAPFLISIFKLPVKSIAGALLAGTFLTSVAGVAIYSLAAPLAGADRTAVRPDWLLGMFFGAGGFCGMYLGARAQKYVPEKIIKGLLSLLLLFLAARYIGQYLS